MHTLTLTMTVRLACRIACLGLKTQGPETYLSHPSKASKAQALLQLLQDEALA